MREDLKCPFCGEKMNVVRDEGVYFKCSACLAQSGRRATFQTAVEALNRRAPSPRKEWKAEDEVGVIAIEKSPGERAVRHWMIQFQDLKPEVQAALSGGGDDRWVLDELKKWLTVGWPREEALGFKPPLPGEVLEKLADLESQASGKVKPNE